VLEDVGDLGGQSDQRRGQQEGQQGENEPRRAAAVAHQRDVGHVAARLLGQALQELEKERVRGQRREDCAGELAGGHQQDRAAFKEMRHHHLHAESIVQSFGGLRQRPGRAFGGFLI